MKFSRRENACFWIGVVSTIFISAFISLIAACYFNMMIVIYVDIFCLILSSGLYIFITHRIENIPEKDVVTQMSPLIQNDF
jgi:hypothetical protein